MTFLATLLAKYAAGRWLQANWAWLKYVLIAVACLLALWWLYSAVWQRGYDAADEKWKDAQRAAEAKAAADTKLLNEAIAEIDTGITIDMEAVANVRTIYRDKVRTIAVDTYRGSTACDVPGGLLEQINAAAQGYASAAASASGSAVRPAKPTP